MFAAIRRKGYEEEVQQAEILLWGPTGSGKDWLLRGFIKEIEHYNKEHPLVLSIFEQLPGGNQPIPVSPAPPINIPPTAELIMTNYKFMRVPTDNNDPAQSVSTYTHDLLITNNKGANLVDALNDPTYFQTIIQMMSQTENIILVLGIPSDSQNESSSVSYNKYNVDQPHDSDQSQLEKVLNQSQTEATNPHWKRETYLKFVRLLITQLNQSTRRRRIAVCMTMVDQLGYSTGMKPWEMLAYRHGEEMRREFLMLKKHHEVEVFATTAAGYLIQNGKAIANMGGGSLVDSVKWNPLNTAQPFFWVFEKIELERLNKGNVVYRNGNRRKYIHYPKTRK